MASFADLIKYQKSQGRGTIGSLTGALKESTLEKIDPRNYLFKKGGTLTALFPGLMGYKAKTTSNQMKSGFKPLDTDTIISKKLDILSDRVSIVAKNTMTLPMMSRDLNIIRQGIIKLVKLSDGNQRDKVDKFFLSSKQREEAYESQFQKNKKETPTVVKEKEEKKSFFGNLLSSFLPNFLTFLKGALLGSLLYGIGKYFTDSEFRKKINDIFESVGELIKEKFEKTLEDIAGPNWKKKLETLLDNLEDLAIAVGGLYITYKLRLLAPMLEFMKKLPRILSGRNVPVPETPGTRGKTPGAPGAPETSGTRGKTPGAPGAPETSGTRGKTPGAPGAPETSGTRGKTPGAPGAPETPGTRGKTPGAPGAPEETKKEQYRDPKTGRYAKAPQPVEAQPKTRWGRFLAFMEKRNKKLFDLVIKRLLAAGAGIFVPGPGWVLTLMNLGFTFKTAWEIYELWQDFSNFKEDTPTPEPKTPETPSTTNRDTLAPTKENVSQNGAIGGGSTTKPSPVTDSAQNAETKSSPVTGSAQDAEVEKILQTIRQHESGNTYDPPKNPNSSASGAYQFTDDTWQRLTKKFGIGTQYRKASAAPPEIQDSVAREYVKDILKRAGGVVAKVPLEWYTGNLEGRMTEKQLKVNKGLTAAEYQRRWFQAYYGQKTPVNGDVNLAQNSSNRKKILFSRYDGTQNITGEMQRPSGQNLNDMSGDWMSTFKMLSGGDIVTNNIVNNQAGNQSSPTLPAFIASVVDEDVAKFLTRMA